MVAAALVPLAQGLFAKLGLGDGVAHSAVNLAASVILGMVAPLLPALLRKAAQKIGG